MGSTALDDRKATLSEVKEHRATIREAAVALALGEPRVLGDGTIVVHSDEPGYRATNELSLRVTAVVGAYVHVITDDVSAAETARPL